MPGLWNIAAELDFAGDGKPYSGRDLGLVHGNDDGAGSQPTTGEGKEEDVPGK